jgi:hypothetical protein
MATNRTFVERQLFSLEGVVLAPMAAVVFAVTIGKLQMGGFREHHGQTA